MEQWFATKIGKVSSAAASPEEYRGWPGCWTEADFLELMPGVQESVERRTKILRGPGASRSFALQETWRFACIEM